MNSVFSRRRMLQAMSATAVFSISSEPSAAPAAKNFRMPSEGKDTPKICLGVRPDLDEDGMRQLKQIGVDYVLSGGPTIPWEEADIRGRMERFKAGGLTLCNLMISGFNDVIWGRPALMRRSRTSSSPSALQARPVYRSSNTTSTPVATEGYKVEIGRAGPVTRRMTMNCLRIYRRARGLALTLARSN